MSRTVNLLLLLSALLSALTGVGASVRQPQQVSALVQRACSAKVAAVQAPTSVRPAQALPEMATVAVAAVVQVAVVPQREPLYFSRRRE